MVAAHEQAGVQVDEDGGRWRSLMAAVPAVVYVCKPSGDYDTTYVSDNVTEQLGYLPDEFLQTPAFWVERLHPHDKQHILDRLAAAIDGKRHSREYRFLHKNGSYVWIRDDCKLLRGADGEPIEIVGCMLDISDLKDSEAALRRREERYRSLVEMYPDGTLVSVDNRIVYANAAALKLFGVESAKELIGRSPLDLVHPDSRPVVLSRIKALRTPGVVVPLVEEKWVRPDGTQLDVQVIASSFREDGSTAVQVVLRDLAEHKRRQRLFEASSTRLRELTHALESVREQERSRLARELHDELGQLLTALRMDAAWIRRHAPETATRLIERAEAMTDLINRIGEATTRIATQLRPRVLDDLGLVAAVRALGAETARGCGIACQVIAGDEVISLPDSLATPLYRMAQEALTNVARHADATSVTISLQRADAELCLTISDDGQGLAEEDLGKQGSYGLLGMRERAAAIGGEVRVFSGAGEGTTIEIRLPFSPDHETL